MPPAPGASPRETAPDVPAWAFVRPWSPAFPLTVPGAHDDYLFQDIDGCARRDGKWLPKRGLTLPGYRENPGRNVAASVSRVVGRITTTLAVAAAVLVGALTQRVSGLGFALIAAPFLVILLGPYAGVSLANVLAILVAGTTLATSWRAVDGRRALTLVPAGLVGVLPGVVAARMLPAAPLQILVGSLVLFGLALTALRPRAVLRAGPAVNTGAGLTSGFMTAASGTGGPALAVYAAATGWRQTAFAPTVQISFASQAALAVGLKGLPKVGVGEMLVFIAAAALGLAVGGMASGRVAPTVARRLAMTLAVLGATGTVAKGVIALLGVSG
jgi:uncharacterized membrane protein YfcA